MKSLIFLCFLFASLVVGQNTKAEPVAEDGRARIKSVDGNCYKIRCPGKSQQCWVMSGLDTGSTGTIWTTPPIHFTLDLIALAGTGVDENGESYTDWDITVQ